MNKYPLRAVRSHGIVISIFVLSILFSVGFGSEKALAWKNGDTLDGDVYCNPPGLWYTIGKGPKGCESIISSNFSEDVGVTTEVLELVKVIITTPNVKEVNVSVDGSPTKKRNVETDFAGKRYVLVNGAPAESKITIGAEGYRSFTVMAPPIESRQSGANPPPTPQSWANCGGSNCSLLTIYVKVPSVPNSTNVFHFIITDTVNGYTTNFYLDDNGNNNDTYSNKAVFSVFGARNYSIDQYLVPGFTTTLHSGNPTQNIGNSSGSPSNPAHYNYTVFYYGDDRSFTFVNTPICVTKFWPMPPTFCSTLNVYKKVPVSSTQVFSFDLSYNAPYGYVITNNFKLDDNSSSVNIPNVRSFSIFPNRQYTLHETPASGFTTKIYAGTPTSLGATLWQGTGAQIPTYSSYLPWLANSSVTFRNAKEGTIKIIKKTVYIGLNGSQISAPSPLGKLFNFSMVGGLTPTSFVLFALDTNESVDYSNQKVFSDVPIGTYTVTEGPASPGGGVISTLQSISCLVYVGNTVVNTINSTPPTVTINLQPGQTVVCTFTNLLTN